MDDMQKYYDATYNAFLENGLKTKMETWDLDRAGAVDYILKFWPTMNLYMELVANGDQYPEYVDALRECKNDDQLARVLRDALVKELNKMPSTVRPKSLTGWSFTPLFIFGKGPMFTITCGSCDGTFKKRVPYTDQPGVQCPYCESINKLPLGVDRDA